MSDFTFTDRATWISWRADWRQRYAQASDTIRATKREMVQLRAQAGTEDRISGLQYSLHLQRRHANALMEERTEANDHKAAQMAERHQKAA